MAQFFLSRPRTLFFFFSRARSACEARLPALAPGRDTPPPSSSSVSLRGGGGISRATGPALLLCRLPHAGSRPFVLACAPFSKAEAKRGEWDTDGHCPRDVLITCTYNIQPVVGTRGGGGGGRHNPATHTHTRGGGGVKGGRQSATLPGASAKGREGDGGGDAVERAKLVLPSPPVESNKL